jgi:hypothetical protein
MAHFAKISEDNIVLAVLVVNDSDTCDENGVENELTGQKFLEKYFNWPSHLWIKCSYNTKKNKYYNQDNVESDPSKAFRGNQAFLGGTWDENNQIFWPKKPYVSWVKDVTTASWKSPIGDAPELTEEQISQNREGTNEWYYSWDEPAYQSNNTSGWVLIDLKQI